MAPNSPSSEFDSSVEARHRSSSYIRIAHGNLTSNLEVRSRRRPRRWRAAAAVADLPSQFVEHEQHKMRNLRNRLVESLLPRSDELKALHGLLESAAERANTVSEMAERLLAQASKIPIPGRVRSPVLLQQLELPGIHLSDFDCAIVGNALLWSGADGLGPSRLRHGD